MAKHICVTVDGSAFSLHALPVAGAVAGPGDVVELLTAVDPVPPFAVPGYAEAAERWAAKRQEAAKAYVAADEAEIRCTFLSAQPTRGLIDYLDQARPDALVMATHGRGPVSRSWIGSTTDRIIRSGTVPVLAVRPEEGEEPPEGPATPVTRVLVPLDGSALAEGGIEGALRVFGNDIELVLLRVVDTGPLPGSMYLPSQVRDREKGEEEAAEYLSGVVASLADSVRSVVSKVRVGDRASSEIVAEAEAEGCDAIALVTHGRGGLARVTLGSVADKVVRMASRLVLILPPSERRD